MNNKIILEPLGDLANRMMVISSGLWLESHTNKTIELIWNLTPELNCSFGKLSCRFFTIFNYENQQTLSNFIKYPYTNYLNHD